MSETPIKAIVVEDSQLAREGLVEMLQHFPDINVVGQADGADAALSLIKSERPELLFLDIHMPGQSGFDLLGDIDYDPLVIFTTAYSEYAIRSFDFQTVDYLLKPISKARLQQAIEKLPLYRLSKVETEEAVERMRPDHRLFLKEKDECFLVPLSDIRCIESCKNYVRIFFDDKSAFVKKSLNQVEQRLPKNMFFRCSRQFVINLQDITEIEEWVNDGFIVTLSDEKKIEISRRNALKLKSMLSF